MRGAVLERGSRRGHDEGAALEGGELPGHLRVGVVGLFTVGRVMAVIGVAAVVFKLFNLLELMISQHVDVIVASVTLRDHRSAQFVRAQNDLLLRQHLHG